MISVCFTIKNRTNLDSPHGKLPLFLNCVESLVRAFQKNTCEWELSISDWCSTDTDYKWLPSNHKIIMLDPNIIPFSRGYGRNVSAENCSYENILFLDTDMIVSDKFIKRCLNFIKKEKVYFPICWSLNEFDRSKEFIFLENIQSEEKTWNNKLNSTGWRKNGTGNCLVTKTIWKSVGKWPEYTKWGREDSHFYDKIKHKYSIEREKDPGLIHCWHPINRD